MFGYIRPDLTELKVKEFQRFRACYCGMCHELRRKYGHASRFILNYDFVFLAMLLDMRGTCSPDFEMRRCAVSPFCKKCVCAHSDKLAECAGFSVILAYWKLCDSVNDEKFFGSLKARTGRAFLKGAYKKASGEYPEFDRNVKSHLSELSEMEASGERSLDKAADRFAELLASAAEQREDEGERRILRQLLYHTGRVIYIADAYDDLKEDMTAGRYNPIAARFELKSPDLDEDQKETVRITLLNSQSMMLTAYELLPENYWSSIVSNILCLGVPDMCRNVLNGTYSTRKRPPADPRRVRTQIGADE